MFLMLLGSIFTQEGTEEHTDSETLTTWVSLEAFATASPLSEKYLNNTADITSTI